jgi:hypothetical protein
MQQHHAVIVEQLGASLDDCIVEVDVDMLGHVDQDDAAERSVDVKIILQQEFCRTRVTAFFRPCVFRGSGVSFVRRMLCGSGRKPARRTHRHDWISRRSRS